MPSASDDDISAPTSPDDATSTPPSGDATDPARRRALGLLVAAGSAVYAGGLALPAACFLRTTGDGGGVAGRWLRVARLDALKDGEPARVQVRGDQRDAFTVTADVTLGSVWLTRRGADVAALSAECPHLGCAVDLASGGKSFGCPCHTSRFGLDGKSEAGPSPRGMDPLATRVVDGWVEVEFRRYRQGAAERVEVGA